MARDTDMVRVEATVPLPPDRAYALFVDGVGGWWPRSVSLLPDPDPTRVAVVMEIDHEVAGRWAERATDGNERVWGNVRELDPPTSLTLDWSVDPDTGEADGIGRSTVEVRFVEVEDEMTTIVVDHRGIDAHGERAAAVRRWAAGEAGWWSVLRAYAAAAR